MWAAGEHWAALIGGDSRRTVEATAWYDNAQTAELELADLTYSASFDGSAVRERVRCTVIDRVGDLVTEDPTSPLAPYGQLIVARAVAGLQGGRLEESVPLGTFVIDSVQPEYKYGWHDPSRALYPTGGSIDLTATDCLTDLVDAQFTGPSAPRGTIAQEIATLCRGYVGVDLTGVPSSRVPASVTYGESKWDAIKDLAGVAGLIPSPGRDGVLRFLRPTVGAPVWQATAQHRSIINATLAHTREGLINQVLATGEQDSDGVSPVRALAQETSGPFRAGGPLKEKLQRHSSSFYRTFAQAKSGAESILARSIHNRTLRIPFECSWNPALDVLDTISLEYNPQRPAINVLIASLEIRAGAASMSGEAIVNRRQL